MKIIIEIVKDIITLFGLATSLYCIGFLIEVGRVKARRKMKVCDNCFEIIKKIQEK